MGYAQLLPFSEILGHITVEEQEEKSHEQEDLHQHFLQIVVSVYSFLKNILHGVAKRCRLSWLTNSALVYEPKSGEGGRGVAESQPMSTVVHRSPNKLLRSNPIFKHMVFSLFCHRGNE
jgi:hypothetical protein